MNTNFPYDEERVAELLRTLPPAPEAWIKAAQELPNARRQMDDILAQFEADKEFRAAANADLEAALEAAGYDVDPGLLPELRERLASV
jgi:hypothetical protein